MSKGIAPFTQAALTRALKAAKNAKFPIRRIELTREGIVMFPGQPDPARVEVDLRADTDEWAIPE